MPMSPLQRSGLTRLASRRLTQFQGADASRFLQALLTNDMKNLTRRGDAIYGAFLSTKGRVIGDCHVLQLQDDAFVLDYDKGVAGDLMKHWKRYKLRMKVAIEDKTDALALYVTLPAMLKDSGSLLRNETALGTVTEQLQKLWNASGEEGEAVVFADPRGHEFGVRAIVPVDATVDVPEGYEMMEPSAYVDRCIALGVAEATELVDGIPLECNLDMLHGVSFRKGCYVGQELTARTQFKGNIRKRIVPAALVPAEQHDVVKALSEGAFKPFDSPSLAALRTYMADSRGWKNVKVPAIGDKVVVTGEEKAVGTIYNVGKDVSGAIVMMRLSHLLPSVSDDGEMVPTMKFSTQDGAFHVVPYQPSWWPQLDVKTGKTMLL
uniref:GCVT N-terminal domain-containing protein n=1 Tax=Peronospora matthiolae TaxID=2874970 RepID=A0AAV1TMV6_9STRA